ncbi:SpoIIE family protein phosphatase [Desulfobacterales bacterium HSG16]|nr:SpoIIE family protein phosphatase [Desulfobacterales bacterium HSG16]
MFSRTLKELMITIGIGGTVTAILMALSWHYVMNHEHEVFEYEAGRIQESVTESVKLANAVAQSMQALFHSTGHVDADQFRIFSKEIFSRYPFIISAMYCMRVYRQERQEFEEEQQDWGFITFQITEHDQKQKRKPAAEREHYFPVIYKEPFSPISASLIGYDILSDPDFHESTRKAAAAGIPISSVPTGRKEGTSRGYELFIATYEGKQMPGISEARKQKANGLISLTIYPERMFDKEKMPPYLSLELDMFSTESGSLSSELFRFLPETSESNSPFSILAARHNIWISKQQRLRLTLSKSLYFRKINLWLPVSALVTGIVLCAGFFIILRGRGKLRRLHLSRMKAETEAKLLAQEMDLARRIQTSLLPTFTRNIHQDFETAATMVTADKVGGDFYDISLDRSGNLWLAIGDVSGHGVTPGLIMMMAQTVHATITANLDCDARDVVVKINEVLFTNVNERLKENHFMTFNALKYLGYGRFEHAGAHLRIIVYRQEEDQYELIRTKGVYLNFKKDISKITKNSYFELGKGDVMVLYTDGLTESENPDGEMLDINRLAEMIKRYAHQEAEAMKENIMADVLDWCDNRREDDMTLVIVKRKEDLDG